MIVKPGVKLKRSFIVSGLAAFSLLLAACSGSASEGASGGEAPSQSAAEAESASPSASESEVAPLSAEPLEEVLVQINVDSLTLGIAADPSRPMVWVTAWDTVVGINTDTNSPTTKVKGFGLPADIAISNDGANAYVVDMGRNALTQVDLESAAIVRQVKVGKDPSSVLLTADGAKVLVTVEGAKQIAVLNAADLSEVSRIDLPGEPDGIAAGPDGTYFTALSNRSAVAQVDIATGEVLRTITVQDDPTDVEVSPDGSTLYVVNLDAETVSVVDIASGGVQRSIPVGTSPSSITVSLDGAYAYVTNFRGGDIDVIDTASNEVINTISLEYQPAYMALSPDGTRGYVSGGDVQVLAPSQ